MRVQEFCSPEAAVLAYDGRDLPSRTPEGVRLSYEWGKPLQPAASDLSAQDWMCPTCDHNNFNWCAPPLSRPGR